jgi:hypothetical protein
MVGLCLVAVFAIASVAATSASALPEFGKCQAKAGGKYTDSNCTKKGTLKNPGNFEWVKATSLPNKSFSGAGGAGILTIADRTCSGKEEFSERTAECEAHGVEAGAAPQVECEKETAIGEVTGTKEVTNVVVKFQGCKILGSLPCSNTAVEGQIQVNVLKGKLGYINKAKKEVGISLTPKATKGEFAKFDCGGIFGTVVGPDPKVKGESAPVYPGLKGGGNAIISPIEPVNTMTTKYTQTYTVNEAAENIPNKFEGGPLQVLEAYIFLPEHPKVSSLWSKAGESITNVNTLEPEGEEGEIKG